MDYRPEAYAVQQYEVIVNARACEYIRDHWESLELGKMYDSNRPTGQKLVDVKEEPTLLMNFFNGFKRIQGTNQARRIDSYKQTKRNPRRMQTTGLSLQGISRTIRHMLCKESMFDLDIANAHPVMLANWCKNKGISCEHLLEFNKNRLDRFGEIQDTMEWTKDEAKAYVLSLTNGGGSNPSILAQLKDLEWFNPFWQELKTIQDHVMLRYPDLVKEAYKAKGKDYFNIPGVVISYLLTNMENQVLQAMVKHCMKSKVNISCLIYDGFMVYKESVGSLDKLCRDLEEAVKSTTGHTVSIVPKEMKDGLEIPDSYMDSEQSRVEKKRLKEEEQKIEKEYKQQQKALKKEAKEQDEKESDFDMSERFLSEFQGKIMYNANRLHGYFYNDITRLWTKFSNFESLQEEILRVTEVIATKDLRNVGHMVKTRLMNRMDDLTMFDMVPGIVSLKDGMVFDMILGGERPRVKEDYCSFFINYHYVPGYDKAWVENYIGELVGQDPALIQQLLELVGYTFSAENSLKYIMFLIGSGDNGKSLFIEMIQTIMGEYQTVANDKIIKKPRFDNNTHEAHFFALLNKRGMFSTELHEKDELNSQSLKRVSGNDAMSIRNSGGQDTISVTLKAVGWIATNVMSQIDDPVIKGRMACIHFPNKFERNANKADEIKSHAQDLFCAFMEGGSRFYQRNKKIELLDQIKNYTKLIHDKLDAFVQFFNDTEFEKDEMVKEYCKDLYESYTDYAKQSGMTIDGKETFYKKVEDKFEITKSRDKNGNFYRMKRI